jgi:hypothetical protein
VSNTSILVLIGALVTNCTPKSPGGGSSPAGTFDASHDENVHTGPDGGDAGLVVPPIRDGAQDGVREAAFPIDGSDAGEVGCYRDPYLPKRYEPPCEQPPAAPNCADGWCTVQPGCYIMGAPWCEPGRARTANDPVQVTVTNAFRIGEFELTQREWMALGLPNRSGLMPDGTGDCVGNDCPASNMTWFEALSFANRLSSEEGLPPCYELSECTGEFGRGMLCNTVRMIGPSIYDAAAIACLPGPNGNTRHGPEPRPLFIPETSRRQGRMVVTTVWFFRRLRGTAETQALRRIRWGKKSLTLGSCTT